MPFLLFYFLMGISAQAQPLKLGSMEQVEQTIQAEITRVGGKKVIVGFDFDNTLLTTHQIVGDERWFTWQEENVLGGKLEKTVAQDFGGLLDIQNRLLGLIRFHPTEPTTIEVVKRLQNKGAFTFVLTSRGPLESMATIRELGQNGLDFAKPLNMKLNRPAPYYPYKVDNLKESGLTKKDLESADLLGKPVRESSFSEGVFFSSGQNKGVMYKTLLHRLKKLGQEFHSVVFVDNTEKHVRRVEKALEGSFKVVPIHYQFVPVEGEALKAWVEKNESRARQEFQKLKPFME